MEKKYNPNIEEKWYKNWIENKYFHSEPDHREAFTIIMPPPNITGVLHLGHILNNTIQDILIRRARMQGKNACWIPGIDHASIATETKVLEYLRKQGIKREDLSRDEFLKYCWEWKEKYGGTIIEQLKKMGCSADWDRLMFTMDDHHSNQVLQAYHQLKNDGLIYKAFKKMNYDPLTKTILSDSEITTDKKGNKISERSGALIEEIESEQFFLKMDEISKPALSKILDGTIKLFPDNQLNSYKHWFEELQDWCISRQLTWGHQIPDSGDALDTWFSSWLWSYSIFKNEKEMKYYFPSNIIITGYDIAFFWIAKMIMASYYFKDEKPFKEIYFTGIMRDDQGRKFSKQLGNSPDVLKLMKEHGADSLRFSTIINHQAGLDCNWSMDLLLQGKRFCNKLWNAQRLIKSWQSDDREMSDIQRNSMNDFENKLNSSIFEIEEKMNKYRFSDSLTQIYKLIWDDFCSIYLEQIKPDRDNYPNMNLELYNKTIEFYEKLLKMLHPFMPFITEEIWHNLRDRDQNQTIMI